MMFFSFEMSERPSTDVLLLTPVKIQHTYPTQNCISMWAAKSMRSRTGREGRSLLHVDVGWTKTNFLNLNSLFNIHKVGTSWKGKVNIEH